ncbi:MAG: glycosyltransferase family 2 protein [Chthoniobacterales bacterium]|nr:glycosyltransferase family 2 protein [Chthoniobacterales bacterium]
MKINYSVVIPLYNHEQYIAEAIESILNQSYPADEILIIDDGSTDNSFHVAQKIASSCSKIKVFKQTNQGAHKTLNKLIELAKNEHIAILNSDDIFYPEKLERCTNLFSNSSHAEFIFGGVDLINEHGEFQRNGIAVDWLDRARKFKSKCNNLIISLLHENYIVTTSNFVFSKKLWNLSSKFQSLRYCHDLDFIIDVLKITTSITEDKEKHIQYRIHKTNTIKEEVSHVDFEIAAVIANSLIEIKERITLDNMLHQQFYYINQVVKNKNSNYMIPFFMLIRMASNSKKEFYQKISDPIFKQLVNR